MSKKYVYKFGGGKADGKGHMKALLGGKGANLADMSGIGVPVPAGFTISTDVCTYYYANKKKYPPELRSQVEAALASVEKIMGRKFGDPKNPLLVSVRSGARMSMPGMMDTVLNIGLTEKTLPGLIETSGDARFAYDSYRRLIMMYSDVVMEKAGGLQPKDGHSIREVLEKMLEDLKHDRGATLDTDLSAEDLKGLSRAFKAKVLEVLGEPFPDDAEKQLWGGIGAVFASWMGKRAIEYRRIEKIPHEWGTAVNCQAMVFGNLGADCSTGVAFTRDPATGANIFYGEYLVNAQGEDVVAGTRTPSPINEDSKNDYNRSHKTLQSTVPNVYKQLNDIRIKLERHYKDMQDVEFTIETGKLWMLQTRNGKRTGTAAVRMAVEMAEEEIIDKATAILRVKPSQLDELLHPMLDPDQEKSSVPVAKGLPAGPGGATGQIVFTADEAEQWAKEGKKVLLVRNETSPEDVHGMHVAQGILTAKGGMTSHAALVARGWGKCCIVGCSDLKIDLASKTLAIDGKSYRQGDIFTLNGSRGFVYDRGIQLVEPDLERNEHYSKLMGWADRARRLRVRTNADTPADATVARKFGAEGIGLCRTEHMFFDPERIRAVRELILASDDAARTDAVMKLLPFQRKDFEGILEAMDGLPVTVRLLDPPLHEFMPQSDEQIAELAHQIGVTAADIRGRLAQLHELNPMLGHRGCRLGITYPMVTQMQCRAIFEATVGLKKRGKNPIPEVMIPLVGSQTEYEHQEAIVRETATEVMKESGIKFKYLVGTMIELPRAALRADGIAERAEFFSFGTNDLTQTTFGFSRDDIGGFLPEYLEKKILHHDPFESIDIDGVGQLVEIGTRKGRSVRPSLKVGVCGEHGGDPNSVEFFHRTGLDYVSCSPFRVPIARFAAAQANLREVSAARRKAAKAKKAAQETAKAAKETVKKGAKAAKNAVSKAAKAVKKTAKKVAKKAAPKKTLKKGAKAAKKSVSKAAKATKKTAKKVSKKAAPKKTVKKGAKAAKAAKKSVSKAAKAAKKTARKVSKKAAPKKTVKKGAKAAKKTVKKAAKAVKKTAKKAAKKKR